ncbi:hypothetical protein [Candidatus Poriferisodalis sp.]|uniref:hypothetical protein n=1 Tax=Candidatus Poriferisodalis sp. TaxID=3101277 RepID=UPI003B525AD9
MAAVACSLFDGEDVTLTDIGHSTQSTATPRDGPAVELIPRAENQFTPLDPSADPQTPLGRLRSQYFPVWTSDFDWAFPPDVCDSAWELDGIAVPVAGVNVATYGDPATMAALAVMRFEYFLSRAFADPTPLAQLCIAVGTVDPARGEALEDFNSLLDADEPIAAYNEHPTEVSIVAMSPTAALATACLRPARQPAATDSDHADDSDDASGHLAAYLLVVSQGLEDAAVDVSYRVSGKERDTSVGCTERSSWIAAWQEYVNEWLSQGQVWIPVDIEFSRATMCADNAEEKSPWCSEAWLQ